MTPAIPSWVSALVAVRRVGDLRVFRVNIGGITVLSYPSQDRAEQVASALRAVIAAAHDRRTRAGRPCSVTTAMVVDHHHDGEDAA